MRNIEFKNKLQDPRDYIPNYPIDEIIIDFGDRRYNNGLIEIDMIINYQFEDINGDYDDVIEDAYDYELVFKKENDIWVLISDDNISTLMSTISGDYTDGDVERLCDNFRLPSGVPGSFTKENIMEIYNAVLDIWPNL